MEETIEETVDRIFLYQPGDMSKNIAKQKAIESIKFQIEKMYTENEVKGMLFEVGNAMRFKGINYASYFNYKNVKEEVEKVIEKFKKKK